MTIRSFMDAISAPNLVDIGMIHSNHANIFRVLWAAFVLNAVVYFYVDLFTILLVY